MRSKDGTTYSPNNKEMNINTAIGFNTANTIRLIEIPAARITVNSLFAAIEPSPAKQPIRHAIGIYS